MIQVQHIAKAYGMKQLLDDITFTITAKDKIGLIGPNGTGKSTLFKIILKEVHPDEGSVTLLHEEVGYLPQALKYAEDDTIFSYLRNLIEEDWDTYKIDMALAHVDLKIDLSTKIGTLSGGQKTKVGIAGLLIKEPTTLLLDEPTNNLDLETLEWLEGFVKSFRGAVLTISHDRAFLDRSVKKIFELDPFSNKLTVYDGGYTDYFEEKARRVGNQMSAYADFEERKSAMEKWIHDKQVQLSVYRNPKVARQLQAMKTRFQKEFIDQEVEKPQVFEAAKLTYLSNELHKKRVVFYIEDLNFKEFLKFPRLTITGGDRIDLQGRNGAGKTTFARILLGLITDYEGTVQKGEGIHVGYFSQEHEMLSEEKTVIDEFMDKSKVKDGHVARRVLGAFQFKGDHVFTKVGKLSQGERVKLIIAQLTRQDNQFLILDEPTNHLDIQSREVLEKALREYEGGLILISHDRYFKKKIGINKVIMIEKGSVSGA